MSTPAKVDNVRYYHRMPFFWLSLMLSLVLLGCHFDEGGIGLARVDAGAQDQLTLRPDDGVPDASRGDSRTDQLSVDMGSSDISDMRLIDGAPRDGVVRDAGIDAIPRDQAAPDMAAPDMALPDTALPDMALSDTASPDLQPPADLVTPDLDPTLLFDEQFQSGLGNLTPAKGSWSHSSGAAKQDSALENGNYALLNPPGDDYEVETSLVIESTRQLSSRKEGAGIGLRVIAGAPVSPPRMIACWLSPDDNVLAISGCDGMSAACRRLKDVSFNVQLGVSYRLRASVIGTRVTCEAPDQGLRVQFDIPPGIRGDVALMTFHAVVLFDYVKVWQR
jgi:hypothetical protein